MADNTELSAGSGGDIISTDDIAGVKVQRVKVQYGVDGSATDVSDTNPLPIDDAGGTLTVDAAELTAIQAAVEGTLTVDNGGTFAVQESRAHTADFDTGAGTDTTAAFGIAVPASGGAAVVPGDATAGLKVNLGADNDVTVTGSVTANAGTNLNTSALALESGGNLATLAGAVAGTEVQVDVVTSALPSGASTAANQSTANTALAAIQTAVEIIDNVVSGSEAQVDVVAALPAGTNVIGDVGISGARTSGGTTIFRSIDVDETEDEVKSSGGQVYWIHAMNLAATVRYLKFYNAAAASVTVGSTTPVMTFAVPTQGDTNGAGFTLSIPNGIAFSTGICVAATTGVADNDTGAPGANEVIVNLGYA